MLIFEKARSGRIAAAQIPLEKAQTFNDLPTPLLRAQSLELPEVSELQAVRHYTQLSQLNFSIDSSDFYPLGSCTMKYNPRGVHNVASLGNFQRRHPLTPEPLSQGYLACAYELQEILKEATGMHAVSLTPMAGAQGEFAGVAMIRAYHEANGDTERNEILVPDAAHGTNPASAIMCGYKVREIKTGKEGDIDIEDLKQALSPETAGIMLTNPSTLGVFERQIKTVAGLVHKAGGLLYYDGANLNAILGTVRPGDMGFDVMHINLHKTFATPHGGGGPGAGPVGANERLAPFLPVPIVGKTKQHYHWLTEKEQPQTIGQLSAFMGNAAIILRAYIYSRLLGREGFKRVSRFAMLNANYLMKRLEQAGFTLAYPKRRASHEFIITLKNETKEFGVTATDFAKRLLDYGIHSPTMYFPLLVPECLLIEPTETESKETLDEFVDVMTAIREEAKTNPKQLKEAPHNLPVNRLDEVAAARNLDIVWRPE